MDQIDNNTHNPHQDGLRLPPLQASFVNQAYQRPLRQRPAVDLSEQKPYGNGVKEVPYGLETKQAASDRDIKEKNVKRRSSRFGLAGFFNRSKPSDVEGRLAKVGIKENEDDTAENPCMRGTEVPLCTSIPEELDALPTIEPFVNPLRHKPSKPAVRAKPSFRSENATKRITRWDPPPLFQAYPQAIKHATLHVPCLSAEAILRLDVSRSTSTNPTFDSNTPDSSLSKPQKEKRLKKHTAAEVLSQGEWTHKIFILVTSGYILQYAGDGNFDRSPEKIMPLTTESAAFASDVIPGQPYVLQVSQVSDDQGTLDKEASRSMLKRLGLRNEMRRSSSTFLLVLGSADEMTAWLVAVRREIQAVGGKECVSDQFDMHDTERSLPSLQQRPSQRYLVTRDPNRFLDRIPEPPSDIYKAKDRTVGSTATENAGIPDTSIGKRQSLATQSSIVSRSASNTTSSINQAYLDQLRASPRESAASADAKTASTSRGSSPKFPPEDDKSEVPDLTLAFAESRPTPSTYSRTAYNSTHKHLGTNVFSRESVRPCYTPSFVQQPGRSSPKNARTPSPATPNFSVPTFSKRYSTPNGSHMLCSTTTKLRTPPISLHKSPTPPKIEEDPILNKMSGSVVNELQYLRKPSLNALEKNAGTENGASLESSHAAGSCDPPPSSEGEKRFSRRLSSLEYSRGLSPVPLVRESPSPHPPPTAALPALPGAASAYRTSLYPPPTAALPPIPTAAKSPQPCSIMPPSTNALQAAPGAVSPYSPADDQALGGFVPAYHERERASSCSKGGASNATSITAKSAHRSVKTDVKAVLMETRRLHRPVSMQAGNDTAVDQPPLPSPQAGVQTAFEAQGLTPPLVESPPKPTSKPTYKPPSLSLQQAHTEGRRSVARVGREPPPVFTPATSPKPRISVSSRAESYFGNPAPHPFIPPIRVSERKFRGSLDGPWNTSWDAPQKTLLDLSVG